MSKKEDKKEVVAPVAAKNDVLYIVIIVLLVIIGALAFFVGRNMWSTTVVNSWAVASLPAEFTITAIDDSRCSECNTQSYIDQFKQMPQFANITFETKDFADDGVAEMLQSENITTLPAFIFSSNQGVSSDMSPFLQALPSGKFNLAIEASFNPFAKRSDRGLLIVEDDVLVSIQETAHIKGTSDAQITWLEYTDVNCFYCKKMETDGTATTILETYPELVNKTTSQFIGTGGATTQAAAEALECIAQVSGSDAYNNVLSQALQSGDNSRSALLASASDLWVNQDQVESCITNWDTKELITSKMAIGTDVFGITGTPGNVLINNQTGEYSILSGAYPADSFKEAIEALK